MKIFLTLLCLVIMLLSGYWMSSDSYFLLGEITINSNWGMVGLALGASLMIIINIKKDT